MNSRNEYINIYTTPKDDECDCINCRQLENETPYLCRETMELIKEELKPESDIETELQQRIEKQKQQIAELEADGYPSYVYSPEPEGSFVIGNIKPDGSQQEYEKTLEAMKREELHLRITNLEKSEQSGLKLLTYHDKIWRSLDEEQRKLLEDYRRLIAENTTQHSGLVHFNTEQLKTNKTVSLILLLNGIFGVFLALHLYLTR